MKISPDLNHAGLAKVASALLDSGVDGVIATNTTLNRQDLNEVRSKESGGLSGQPLHARSVATIRRLRSLLGDALPIIAAGGIASGAQALAAIDAGAQLVQVYTGLVYERPRFNRPYSSIFSRTESLIAAGMTPM